MYETILLATDGSRDAETALAHSVGLASASGGTLHIVSVVETRTAYDNAIIDPEEVRKNLRKDASEVVEDAKAVAEDAGVECETDVVEGPPPTESSNSWAISAPTRSSSVRPVDPDSSA